MGGRHPRGGRSVSAYIDKTEGAHFMTTPHPTVRCRRADTSDVATVAELHAESWRRHYRGAYSDSYLDGDVNADRLALWTERLCRPDSTRVTLIAEDAGRLVGFAHVILDEDPVWGALLDNLH